MLCFSILTVSLEEYHWLFSLTSHFREWFLVLSAVLILFVPWVTKYRVLFISLVFSTAIFHSWVILPYWGTLFQKNISYSERTNTVDIFFANLNSQNQEKHLLINYLQDKQPEIVLLVEVNRSWLNEIKKIESLYPYSKAIAQEGNFGMAILSKKQLEVENVFVDRANMIPAMVLKSKSTIGMLNMVLLHVHPPIGKYGTLIRDRYLDTLSRKLNRLNLPLLVCGDFNTTPWTPVFQNFLGNSGLEYSKNHLLPNTWPSAVYLPSLPIDHCLVKGVKIVKYSKGPNIGSDHWPLEIEITKDDRTIAGKRNQDN